MSSKWPGKPDWISQEDRDDVDSPALTAAQMGRMRPGHEVHPEFVERMERLRIQTERVGRMLAPIPIRAMRQLKLAGEDWQDRLCAALEGLLDGKSAEEIRARAGLDRPPAGAGTGTGRP